MVSYTTEVKRIRRVERENGVKNCAREVFYQETKRRGRKEQLCVHEKEVGGESGEQGGYKRRGKVSCQMRER